MDRYFAAQSDEEYRSWAKSDKKIFKKINDLIDDIEENGFLRGAGKHGAPARSYSHTHKR